MAEPTTYERRCHCGRVTLRGRRRFEPGHVLQLLDLPPARLMLTFVPDDEVQAEKRRGRPDRLPVQ